MVFNIPKALNVLGVWQNQNVNLIQPKTRQLTRPEELRASYSKPFSRRVIGIQGTSYLIIDSVLKSG